MSELVSKCVLRLEVKEPIQEDCVGAEASSKQKFRNERNVRDISVETFPSSLESPRDDWGLLPVASRETTPPTSKESQDNKDEIGFFSGNPFVEITKGILHLYKEDVLTSRKEAMILCLLGIPASLTCRDLLAFTAPCHEDISHIRVLRDAIPNQYMALLNFRSNDSAMEFYSTFNGLPFNSLEPDSLCRIVWVSNVEWAHDGAPPPGHTELPICPVCLERMDESVDGVLTILCNHTFHSSCLEQWTDSTCPVCRFVQSPEQAESSECEQCGKSGPSPDALWICLICGHVGCGRYQGGHAASHYRESGHCYALQLGSHRVWDYKGDNFVHRLLQNKGDGKLVAAEGPPSEAECAQEKVDSVQLEFTYLLTSQLDEQRMYFEEKLAQKRDKAEDRAACIDSTGDVLKLVRESNEKHGPEEIMIIDILNRDESQMMKALAAVDVGALKDCCSSIFNRMLCDDVARLCLNTRQSSDNWKRERQFRVTGSRCYALFTYSKGDWVSKSNSYFWPIPFSNRYVRHGTAFEDVARRTYEEFYDREVLQTGLIVSKTNPWLAYSPDGIVVEKGIPIKVLEIKCVYKGKLESQLLDENKDLRDDLSNLMDENKDLLVKLNTLSREKVALEKKLNQQTSKLTVTLHDLNEEKHLGKALRNNQQQWQTKFSNIEAKYESLKKTNELEMKDLKEQVRDLMFFIDAQQVIEKSENKEEIVGGTVTIGESPETSKGKKGRRRH